MSPIAVPSAESAEPPRALSWSTRIALRFGNTPAGAGILLLGLISIGLWWVYLPEHLAYGVYCQDGISTRGEVVEEVVHHDSDDGPSLYRVSFSYQDGDQTRYQQSYSLGSYGKKTATVRHHPERPACAAIEGLQPFPWEYGESVGSGIFFGLLALVALGLMLFGWLRNRKVPAILRDGLRANGVIWSRQACRGPRNNSVHGYNLEIAYQDQAGQDHKSVALHIEIPPAFPRRKGGTVRLLYLPRSPSDIVILDHLPGEVTLQDDGQLAIPPDKRRNLWLYAASPLAVNALYWLVRLVS